MRVLKKLSYGLFGFAILSAVFFEEPPKEDANFGEVNRSVQKDPVVTSPKPPPVRLETTAETPKALVSPDVLVEPEKAVAVTSTETLSAPPKIRFVTGSVVNLRAGPSTKNPIVTQLKRGEKAMIFEENASGWSKVSTPDGRFDGWMASRYLASAKPNAPSLEAPTPRRSVSVPTSREITIARNAIIRQSIAAYPGSCPCPFNTDRAGRRCGKRSAWSRPGGYSPICYDSDVSEARLNTYLARQRGASN